MELDRTKERVHVIVARWMRRVLKERGWSARHWAELAGVDPSSVTRIMSPPEGTEPITPLLTNIFKLSQACGSQPDLIHGNRRQATFEPVRVAAKRKAG